MSAFNEVVYLFEQVNEDYNLVGYSVDSEDLMKNYNSAFNVFKEEFEI